MLDAARRGIEWREKVIDIGDNPLSGAYDSEQ
jgi:hypothetical protein